MCTFLFLCNKHIFGNSITTINNDNKGSYPGQDPNLEIFYAKCLDQEDLDVCVFQDDVRVVSDHNGILI